MFKSESWGSYTEWEATGASHLLPPDSPSSVDSSASSYCCGRNVVYVANIRPSEGC